MAEKVRGDISACAVLKMKNTKRLLWYNNQQNKQI